MVDICMVTSCLGAVTRIGLCAKHGSRFYTHGSIYYESRANPSFTLEQRLKHKGWVVDGNNCWNWQGFCGPTGYGTVRVGKTMRKAHRVAYEVWVGPIPAGLYVLHSCDNPSCINPKHLRPGTQKENMEDKVARGRSHEVGKLFGDQTNGARLTNKQAQEIYDRWRAGEQQRALAKEYGLSTGALSCLVNGKSWAKVVVRR